MNSPLTPKQERKRQKIISVAIKLFVKYGIQGTSMQLLAKRADMSTGSIYNYFANKEALIKEIFQQLIEEEREYILIDYDDTRPIRERFEHLIRRSILHKANDPDKFHFRKQYVHTPGVMNDLQSSDVFLGHPLGQLAMDAQAQKVFKPFGFEEGFYFSSAGLSGFLNWKLFAGKGVTEEDIQTFIDLLWDALSVRG